MSAGPCRGVGQQARTHGLAHLDARQIGLGNVGIDDPLLVVHDHRQRLARFDPDPGGQGMVQIPQLAVERRAQRQPLQFVLAEFFLGLEIGLLRGQQLALRFAVGQPHQAGDLAFAGQRQLTGFVLRNAQRRGVQHKHDVPRLELALLRHGDDLRRERRVDELLVVGMDPAETHHAAVERKHQDHQHDRAQHPQAAAPGASDLGPALPPDRQFLHHRPADEPVQLQRHEHEAQQLEEEHIDQHRDAEKHHQPITPGDQREGDQHPPLGQRKALGPFVLQAQQAAAQPDPGQRARALVQIGQVQEVARDEIAVKAHERAGVDRQRHHPAGGGQEKQAIAKRTVGRQRPGQGGHTGQRKFHRDARAGDHQPLARILQAPALTGVGVHHGKHDQKRHPHVGHAHAVAGGGKSVPQLVHGLGEHQRQPIAQHTGPGQVVHQGVGEDIPLAGHQVHA